MKAFKLVVNGNKKYMRLKRENKHELMFMDCWNMFISTLELFMDIKK